METTPNIEHDGRVVAAAVDTPISNPFREQQSQRGGPASGRASNLNEDGMHIDELCQFWTAGIWKLIKRPDGCCTASEFWSAAVLAFANKIVHNQNAF